MSEAGARERVLARVRAAIGQPGASGGRAGTRGQTGAPGAGRTSAEVAAEYAALPRGYLRAHHDPAGHDIVALFAERAADYRAVVEQVAAADLATAIASALTARAGQAGQPQPWFAVPAGLPAPWLVRAGALRLVPDEPPLPVTDLDACAGVLTGCAVAIAETGTIVLDHGPEQGRRALTLVPDFHLVVVRHEQIVPDLPDAVARMDPARPQTLIAGPSATSDIELIRVEGVHGPRTLHVLVTP